MGLFGVLFGGMMVFDMGGFINKVVYIFSIGLLMNKVYGFIVVMMVVGMMFLLVLFFVI